MLSIVKRRARQLTNIAVLGAGTADTGVTVAVVVTTTAAGRRR
jgi:hypothetical protein